MEKKKLVVVANCQGGTLFNRFIGRASAEFSRRYELTHTVRVHLLAARDAARIVPALEAADVIVAQPWAKNPVAAVTAAELKALAARSGKQLHWISSPHFDCLLSASVPAVWLGKHKEYPFGATEDLALASAFVLGMRPRDGVEVFHDVPLLDKQQLLGVVEQNVNDLAARERDVAGIVQLSDYYADNWARQRLHYVKGHPTAAVYREWMQRVGPVLGLNDMDPALVADAIGNDQFAMPIKRWVKQSLGLAFEDAEDVAMLNGEKIPFLQLARNLWGFYKTIGRDQVKAALALEQSPVYATIRDAVAARR